MDWIIVKHHEHNENLVWVECILQIKNNETGEIREDETVELLNLNEEYPSVHNWKESNYSCYCNRHLFFKRASDEEETDEDWDVTCSDGRYSVNLKNKKNGKVYYREFEDIVFSQP